MSNDTFLLRLVENKYPDLYPYDLVLDEGISRLYRAELTVLSEERHTQQALAANLLNKAVSMGVSQKLQDKNVTRTRYLHGIITGIKSSGVFGAGNNTVYSYVLIIEPKLARLRFTRSTRPFYRKTPIEIITEILTEHRIITTESLPSDYFTIADYNSYGMFDQYGSSDLAFLWYILSLYGLSFTFQHKSFTDDLVEPDLIFSNGKTFPVSDINYSDGRTIPPIVEFWYLASDEARSFWKMDRWSMSENIGVDGLELTAPYPNSNYGSSGWYRGITGPGNRYFNYSSMFHGYQRDAENAGINADVSLILDSSYRALHLAKSLWTGAAANLALQPGSIFELEHFYGDDTLIRAMVTALHLHCRALWPTYMGALSEGTDQEITEAQIRCADYDDNTGCGTGGWRFCTDPRLLQ
ncbi:MAG: phage late control D family protein [Spirochaetaceae bacterium]|jgi:hypothetical protein|nr:phage late control D family protein [Spirochaetaceae bacterium]